MIFITLMHQFNVIIHVKKVCGYVRIKVSLCQIWYANMSFCLKKYYKMLTSEDLEGTEVFEVGNGHFLILICQN